MTEHHLQLTGGLDIKITKTMYLCVAKIECENIVWVA